MLFFILGSKSFFSLVLLIIIVIKWYLCSAKSPGVFMKNYFWREHHSLIFCLLNLIHSENVMYSAEELLPKYFFF